jgi:hypothetical protein
MSKTKKTLLIVIGTVIGLVVIVILFISPIAKYLVEKYDEKYTGRQIKMDWAYVNPFTGYIHLSNVKIYEYKSDSVFLSSGITARFALYKLFNKTYEISNITLNRPHGIVIQDKKKFNFSDLIDKFSAKDTTVTLENEEPVHFNILDIRIKNGEFYYHDKVTPIYYFIKEVNIESKGKQWDVDSMLFDFAFKSGPGKGDIKGKFSFDVSHKRYAAHAIIKQFDLQIIAQYLKDLTNYGTFTAFLDADLNSTGSFLDKSDVTMNGKISVSDLHFGKNPQEDYLSFERLMLAVEDLSPKKKIYSFDSIALDKPYFKYERYDRMDNIQNIFGRRASNIKEVDADETKFNLVIELARYVKTLVSNFFESPYKIDRLNINAGNFVFNDFAINEKFTIRLDPLYVVADSIDRTRRGGRIFFDSQLKPHGKINVVLIVNPDNNSDFTISSYLQKVPASMFNPYTITYTSYPLNRGTLEFNSIWNIKDGKIHSNNHLLIIDPKITKRVKNENVRWIPTPLIMTFAREYGNVIDYHIPINGDLKSPKFNLSDVLLDLLENILVKPVTSPYSLEVRSLERKIEKLRTIKWPMRQNLLRRNQEKFIKEVAEFLKKNPETTITIQPRLYAVKEKEYILFFEAKKKYFSSKRGGVITEQDSVEIDRMSVKDSMFIRYLDSHVKDSLVFTVQEKCSRLIDSSYVNQKYAQLNKSRRIVFMSFFEKEGVQKQINFSNEEYMVPYNGFSFYKIDYKGDFPEALNKAYDQMEEFNEEAPREKFKSKRRKYSRL